MSQRANLVASLNGHWPKLSIWTRAQGAIFRRARWLAKRHARGRFFWMPCPICGSMFSGWEWRLSGYATIRYVDDPHKGSGICEHCAATGQTERYEWDDNLEAAVPAAMGGEA